MLQEQAASQRVLEDALLHEGFDVYTNWFLIFNSPRGRMLVVDIPCNLVSCRVSRTKLTYIVTTWVAMGSDVLTHGNLASASLQC